MLVENNVVDQRHRHYYTNQGTKDVLIGCVGQEANLAHQQKPVRIKYHAGGGTGTCGGGEGIQSILIISGCLAAKSGYFSMA